ncbi:hypothetical protein HY410_00995 [Candidatus Gottesmanbacteria bacterium]|nr:hypothetical protein [Candidatus Gottesmanbacteria bacterium]
MNFVFLGTPSEQISGTQNVTEKFPRSMIFLILGAIIVWKAFLQVIVIVAPHVLPATGAFFPDTVTRAPLPESVWVWGNFDGAHYVSIARSGYFTSTVPFFPLYPYLIKIAVEVWRVSFIVAGQLLSVASLWLSLLVIVYLLREDQHEGDFPLLLAVLIVFPTSFYYAAIYNDALFLLLATLTLLFARRRQWTAAGVTSALATLTRLNGLALTLYLIVEYSLATRGRIVKLFTHHGALFAILAPLFSFLGYLFYVERTLGSWQLVFSGMRIWQQDKLTLPVQVVWRYLTILSTGEWVRYVYWVATLEFFFVLLYTCLLVYSWKRIRLSYWVFFFTSILIPMLTGTFAGMPRYGLHLYPFFLTLTILLSRAPPFLRMIYFSISVVLLVVFLTLFSRGYFVS